jgi:tetratricopeptide (TPR) repeat protein
MENRKYIILSVVMVAVIALGAWFYTKKQEISDIASTNQVAIESTTTNTSTNNNTDGTGSINVTNTGSSFSSGGGYGAVSVKPPQEVFGRSIVASDQTKKRIAEITAELQSQPNDLDNWLELGVLYKSAKDYEGARLVWEYASLIRPKNTSSFANLGDLYHFYLKDYVKAEYNLKKMIENDPKMTEGYVRLFDLYSISYKTETTLAADILKKGIEVNPKDVGLMITLGDYYKQKEAYPLAKMSYEQALSVAKESKNNEQIAEITKLINSLP